MSTEERGISLGKFLNIENDRNLFIEISNRYGVAAALESLKRDYTTRQLNAPERTAHVGGQLSD